MDVGRHTDGRVLTYDEATGSFALGDEAVTEDQLRWYVDAKFVQWDSPEWRTWFEQQWKSTHGPKAVKPGTAVAVIAVALIFIFVAVGVSTRGLREGASAPSAIAPPAAVQTPAAAQSNVAAAKVDAASLLSELRAEGDAQVSDVQVKDNGSGSVFIDVYTTYEPKSSIVAAAKGLAISAASASTVSDSYPRVSVQVRIWPASRSFYMVRVSGDWTSGHLDAPFDIYVNDVLK